MEPPPARVSTIISGRVSSQRLKDYFQSQTDMSMFIVSQQDVVQRERPDWSAMAAADQDAALDAVFAVPDMPSYDVADWGKSIVSLFFSFFKKIITSVVYDTFLILVGMRI